MENFDVIVEKRQISGKSAIRSLKNEGYIPGIIYGDGENIPISVEESGIRNLINKQGEKILLNLSFDGKPISARIQEVQRDPVNKEIQHIDLMALDKGVLH